MPGPLPKRRTDDFEETLVRVTRAGGFTLQRVFYTVPSRLVGHRLRVRAVRRPPGAVRGHGAPHDAAPGPRGSERPAWAGGGDYRHVLASLRSKPMALLNRVCRDDLFPRDACRRGFDALLEALGGRKACRRMVDLLARAHDQCCEARLAARMDVLPDAGELPDPALLCEHFSPQPGSAPDVDVVLPRCRSTMTPAWPEDSHERPLRRGPAPARPAAEAAATARHAHSVAHSFTERAAREGWPPVRVLASGNVWLGEGANVLLFGPPDLITYCTTVL